MQHNPSPSSPPPPSPAAAQETAAVPQPMQHCSCCRIITWQSSCRLWCSHKFSYYTSTTQVSINKLIINCVTFLHFNQPIKMENAKFGQFEAFETNRSKQPKNFKSSFPFPWKFTIKNIDFSEISWNLSVHANLWYPLQKNHYEHKLWKWI